MFIALLENLSIFLQFTSSEPYVSLNTQTVRVAFIMFPQGWELRTKGFFYLKKNKYIYKSKSTPPHLSGSNL